MAELVKKLEHWLRKQVYIEREEGRCERFTLRHVLPTGKAGNEVLTQTVPDQLQESTCEGIAQEFETAASSDASGLGGVQTYVIQAICGEEGKSVARMTFRVAGEDDNADDDSMSSEPATKTGLTAQAMRHTEAIMRNSVMMQGQVYGNMQRMLDSAMGALNDTLNEKLAMVKLIEDLATEKHRRELETKKEEHSMMLKTAAYEKLALLAPGMINKLSGKKLLPEAASPVELGIRAFADSLTPQQLEVISQTLHPEQMIALGSILQKEELPNEQPANRLKSGNGKERKSDA
jgi:hypothetical protein